MNYMDIALKEAEKAAARGEVPIGAVVVDSTTGEIVAVAGNQTEADYDPSAHGEVVWVGAFLAYRPEGVSELADYVFKDHICQFNTYFGLFFIVIDPLVFILIYLKMAC